MFFAKKKGCKVVYQAAYIDSLQSKSFAVSIILINRDLDVSSKDSDCLELWSDSIVLEDRYIYTYLSTYYHVVEVRMSFFKHIKVNSLAGFIVVT
nr:MAG TPA: hypothetical protein [Caudoviricetes sp.]